MRSAADAVFDGLGLEEEVGKPPVELGGAVELGNALEEAPVPFKRMALRYNRKQTNEKPFISHEKMRQTSNPARVSVELSLALITPTPP